MQMAKMKEESDKRLLNLEILIGVVAVLFLVTMISVSMIFEMEEWQRLIVIIIGIIVFLVCMIFALRIEQVAGYYECGNCHYKYVPTYKSVFLAQHINRTRRMKCPKCGKKTWNKKVLK